MSNGYLSDQVYPVSAITPTAGLAAATLVTSSAIDTEATACDGVMFAVHFGTIVSGAVTSLKIQQSSDDAATDDYTDVLGTNQTVADTNSNKTFIVDIRRPGKRYLKILVSRGTQNATVSALAYLYNLRQRPVTVASAQVGGTEKFVSPIEGTA